MGNITENPVWEDNVLQIEVGDSVRGGPSAVVNLQAQDLANRTKWLKENKFDASNFGEFYSALVSPSITGSATLNGTTNNTVQLTGIVTTLGLEVGDVIRIQYSGYDKLHTVESITNANSIIVNYEHAGNRCNGSLKLANRTGNVTIKRIAKWFNAPIGLGRAWIAFTPAQKTLTSTVQFNNTGREMLVSVLVNVGVYGYIQTYDGISWVNATCPTLGGNVLTAFWAVVPRGHRYRLGNTTMFETGAKTNLTELR